MSIADGLIGAGATGALAVAAWFLKARGEVRDHARLVRERDEDLDTWLGDEQTRFQLTLKEIDNDLARRGLLESGERLHLWSVAAEEMLHRWRDQERQARRMIDELRVRDTIAHRFWRRRGPFLKWDRLRTPERGERLLDYWRGFAQDDPTKRGLTETLASLESAVKPLPVPTSSGPVHSEEVAC